MLKITPKRCPALTKKIDKLTAMHFLSLSCWMFQQPWGVLIMDK